MQYTKCAYYIDTMPRSKLTEFGGEFPEAPSKLAERGQTTSVDIQKHLGFQMWRRNNLIQAMLKACLDEFGLTYVQYLALACLVFDLNKRAMNQKQLAKTLAIDEMTASQVIRILERKGFLTRTKGIIDGRAVSIRATAKGAKTAMLAQKAVEDHEQQIRSIVEGLEAIS